MLYFENFCGETAHAAPSAAWAGQFPNWCSNNNGGPTDRRDSPMGGGCNVRPGMCYRGAIVILNNIYLCRLDKYLDFNIRHLLFKINYIIMPLVSPLGKSMKAQIFSSDFPNFQVHKFCQVGVCGGKGGGASRHIARPGNLGGTYRKKN